MLFVALALLYPLADGKCDEYARLDASVTKASPEITLYLYQDTDYVWLCHTAAATRMTWDDIVIVSPAYLDGLNLHASAQLGQWPANDPDAAPDAPDSPLWWKVSGWWANTPHRNDNGGMARGREFQIAKDAFGRGVWTFAVEIRGTGGDQDIVAVPLTITAE